MSYSHKTLVLGGVPHSHTNNFKAKSQVPGLYVKIYHPVLHSLFAYKSCYSFRAVWCLCVEAEKDWCQFHLDGTILMTSLPRCLLSSQTDSSTEEGQRRVTLSRYEVFSVLWVSRCISITIKVMESSSHAVMCASRKPNQSINQLINYTALCDNSIRHNT